MKPASLSVIIVACNEARCIHRCLESVDFADEILVVDSGSTDRTVDICRERGARVIERDWPGYCAQKQFALDQAQGTWVLNLDADELLSPAARDAIRRIVAANDPSVSGYVLCRRSWYLGRWISHGGWYPDRKLRLGRRSCSRWAGADPHDRMHVDGPVKQLEVDILHHVYHDLAHQLRTVDSFSTVACRTLAQQGTRFRLSQLLLRPVGRFLSMYVWKRGFLDGMPGFIIAVVTSYYVFCRYAKLWEYQRTRSDGS